MRAGVAALVMLTACKQTVAYQPVAVEMPVAVACAGVPVVPDWPTMNAQAGLLAQTKATLAELELRKAYEAQLLAVLQGCS